MAMRWNFRLGPLQFTSPVGLIGGSVLAGFVLCCCGSGIIGAFMDDTPESTPPAVVVETSAPEATPEAVEPTEQPEPTEEAATGARPVTPGAFCDTAGETGVTNSGTAMVCRGPGDLRWRRP